MSTKTKGDILAKKIELIISDGAQQFPRIEILQAIADYRKPWTLGRSVNGFTLGDGQEWHRQDFTEDMLPEGWRPFIRGEREADGDEELRGGDWRKIYEPFVVMTSPLDWHSRTRRPLPSVKKMIPLGPEDVPPGSVIRGPATPKSGFVMITTVGIDGVIAGQFTGYHEMKTWNWEISRDNGKTWQKCEKEAK